MQKKCMKAIIKPKRCPGLRLVKVAIPEIGKNDVLIKVKAASICGSDLPIYEWDDPWIRDTIQPELIIGHEFCGIIVDRGERVQDLLINDFVTAEGHLNCGTCVHCRNGESHICPNLKLIGFERPGAFAEYIAVPATNVIKLKNIKPSVGAILDAFGNAVHAILKVSIVNAIILVTGCGPLGLMVIMLAKRLGAQRIFATDISEYRINLAKKIGADIVLNPTTNELETFIKHDTTLYSGVDILFEMSGDPFALKQGFNVLRNGGNAILMGLSKKPILFDFANSIVAKGISVYGTVGRTMYQTWNHVQRFLNTSNNFNAIDLTTIITHRLMVDNYEEGFQLMLSKKCGKVILCMDEDTFNDNS